MTATRNCRLRTAVLSFAMLAVCGPAASVLEAQTLLLENARVIVGDGRVLDRASVLIDDGQISAIGMSAASRASGADVIDLSGKTVMPALIDGHAHLGYQGPAGWGAASYDRENLIDNLERYAYYGFAAVFSAGSDPIELIATIQAEQAAGAFVGARPLFAAGMAPPGQGPNNRFLAETIGIEQRSGMRILSGLSDPAQAREAVAAAAAAGVQFIKIWVDDRGGTQTKLSPAIYRAVIEAAAARNVKVFVHQQSPADMPGLLDAGVDGFLHGRLGPDFDIALARLTAARGAFVVPNLGLAVLRREAIGEDPFLAETHSAAALRPITAAASERVLTPPRDGAAQAAIAQSLAGLLAEGVDIMLGTDAGAVPDHPYGYSGHRELELYVQLGMTPLQALMAGTSVAARHLGLDDMGALIEGNSADLVVLAANPLEDIRNTRRIEAVYLRGRAVDRAALAARWTAGN